MYDPEETADRNERVEKALRGRRFHYKWIRVPCPFCADIGHADKKTSLGVQASNGVWHCFRCGEGGRLKEPPDPAQALLEAEPGDPVEAALTPIPPPDGFPLLGEGPGLTSITLEPARDYLRSRNVDEKLVRLLGLGAVVDGKYANRIIVPFHREGHDDWLGWIGRLWCKPQPWAEGLSAMKYIYPKGMPRGMFLYNHAAVHVETDEPLIIVEGAFDTWPFYPDGAAVLGKPSNVQVEALKLAKRPVAIMLDGDAWEESWILAARLRFEGCRAGFVKLPPRTDPDEVPLDWARNEARRCINAPL